jgi:hypothetical protein
MDDDQYDLARHSLRRALRRPEGSLAEALDAFGWHALAEADEAFAFTALFEELGAVAPRSDALDVVTAASLSLQGPSTVIWPVGFPWPGVVPVRPAPIAEGVAMRSLRDPRRAILAPRGDRLCVLNVDEVEETPLVGMAAGSGWVHVRVHGTSGTGVGSWSQAARRARLAVASELAAVTGRILDVATEQVSTRRQFGRPIGANQSVRFRLAEAFAELAGARALIEAAWEDGSPDASVWAKAVAGATHDSVAKQALQVCGAVGLSDEHPLPALVRRGFSLDALLGGILEQDVGFGGDVPQPVGRY